MLVKFERALNKFISGVSYISAAVMIAMMIYVCVDAFMRNINRSFVGSNELIMNVVAIVIFLGIGITSAHDGQIKIDVFRFFPKLDYVSLTICMVMYILSGIAAFKQAKLVFDMAISSPFLDIPQWPFLTVTGFGLVLCGLGTLCVLIRKFTKTEQEGEK